MRRHFGRLMVTRPFVTKPGFTRSEWLKGRIEKAEADDEALALLTDPRDTIDGVYFWSLRYEQFDGKWLRRRAS